MVERNSQGGVWILSGQLLMLRSSMISLHCSFAVVCCWTTPHTDVVNTFYLSGYRDRSSRQRQVWGKAEPSTRQHFDINAGYEINVSWYPVSSKLTSDVCEHCRLFEDSSYQKILTLAHICWGYLKMLQGSGFFETHCTAKILMPYKRFIHLFFWQENGW